MLIMQLNSATMGNVYAQTATGVSSVPPAPSPEVSGDNLFYPSPDNSSKPKLRILQTN